MSISGITGFPSSFAVNPIVIPRNFQDSNSVRLGGEYGVPLGPHRLDLRAGVSYETSAVPPDYESALTVDMDKVIVSTGVGFHAWSHWRFDLVYAHVFAETVTSNPSTAGVPAINPVQGNPTPSTAINGGTYSAEADVIGLGVAYTF
jgi:long-chain fatty acid transport protein